MKASYLIPEFRETVHRRFPEREAELNAAFEKRIAGLRARILPGLPRKSGSIERTRYCRASRYMKPCRR